MDLSFHSCRTPQKAHIGYIPRSWWWNQPCLCSEWESKRLTNSLTTTTTSILTTYPPGPVGRRRSHHQFWTMPPGDYYIHFQWLITNMCTNILAEKAIKAFPKCFSNIFAPLRINFFCWTCITLQFRWRDRPTLVQPTELMSQCSRGPLGFQTAC